MKTIKNIYTIAISLTLAVALLNSHTSEADTCYYLYPPDAGDNYLMGNWKCEQNLISYWWNAFDFDKNYWDDGMGYDDCCNNEQPLARTFNALYSLGYSSTNSPHCNTSYNNMTLWAMCWSADKINKTRAKCGSGKATGTFATTTNRTVELFWPFFYGSAPSARASTIVHEARHASGCRHNGGSSCPQGSSCDKAWNNGCKDKTNWHGANQYQAVYLSWYMYTATRITPALREAALGRANAVLGYRFNTDPCFRYNEYGQTIFGFC